jgi:hypothetical protein
MASRESLLATSTDDRRASRVALTDTGKRRLADASTTYEAEMATVLDATLSTDEQQRLHDLVTRLLAATNDGEPARRSRCALSCWRPRDPYRGRFFGNALRLICPELI